MKKGKRKESIIILWGIKIYATKNNAKCSPLYHTYKPTIISNQIAKKWANIQEANGLYDHFSTISENSLYTIQNKKRRFYVCVNGSHNISLLVFFLKYNMYRDPLSVDYIKLLQLSFYLLKLCENFLQPWASIC